MRILVTGGVRSGKSAHAESLLTGQSVTYVAPGPSSDDADWSARIAAHRARRPVTWTTIETGDLVAALAGEGSILIDCLGTWLTRFIDERELWGATTVSATAALTDELDRIVAAVQDQNRDLVFVTNEVGLGVIPEHRSGRLFRDLLGLTNQRLAAVCDEVHLVIAGRVITL